MDDQVAALARQDGAASAAAVDLDVLQGDVAAGAAEDALPALALAANEAHRSAGLPQPVEGALDEERNARRQAYFGARLDDQRRARCQLLVAAKIDRAVGRR